MLKEKIETCFRSYVKEKLSPKQEDISFVSSVYASFTDVLGINYCRQIGSFPRYTAIRPLHDLDILYKIGSWDEDKKNPENILKDLEDKFKKEYKNPTSYKLEIKVQTHSISFLFMDGDEEYFGVDIVPAMNRGTNEFGDETFYVPEIVKFRSHNRREFFYKSLRESNQKMQWIKTDPLGYITVASNINKSNSDFRKSVKLIKGWKNHCKQLNEEFKLKSFHLEQLITEQLKLNANQTIYDSIFECLANLKDKVRKASIKDRADDEKFIDQYVEDLNEYQIKLIHQAVDAALKHLEDFDGDVEEIVNAGFFERSPKEEFLFDSKIPVFEDETLTFDIDGFIKNVPGFRPYTARLSSFGGKVTKGNSIKFHIVKNDTGNDSRKWKIKNDDKSTEPRGEIGYENESIRAETTAYYGSHYTECYAIKNGVCIARSQSKVII